MSYNGTLKSEVLRASFLELKMLSEEIMEKCICLPLCSLTVSYYQCEDEYWHIVLVNETINSKRKPSPSGSLSSQTSSQISSIFLKKNIYI